MKTEKIILDDSPEAAQLKQLELWVTRDGRIYADERTARYAGCTHRRCECGGIAEKHYVYCQKCRDRMDKEKYEAMPFKEWDGETPVVIYGSDQYFFDDGAISDYCEDNEISEEDLMLVLCKPSFAWELDGDMYCDILPEDGELPDEIKEAFEEFNKKIKAYNKPLSWTQGKERTSCAQPRTSYNTASTE